MSVKLLILKSYEDVIAEVTAEDINGDWYEVTNPFVTRLEDDNTKVVFYPYIPLSKQKTIRIPSNWVVTVVDPIDEVTKSYLEQLNAEPENSNTEE
jgi:hypothetical protein